MYTIVHNILATIGQREKFIRTYPLLNLVNTAVLKLYMTSDLHVFAFICEMIFLKIIIVHSNPCINSCMRIFGTKGDVLGTFTQDGRFLLKHEVEHATECATATPKNS